MSDTSEPTRTYAGALREALAEMRAAVRRETEESSPHAKAADAKLGDVKAVLDERKDEDPTLRVAASLLETARNELDESRSALHGIMNSLEQAEKRIGDDVHYGRIQR